MTEDRKSQGLFLQMPVTRNISAAIIDRITAHFLVNHQKEVRMAEDFVGRLHIKTPGVRQLVVNLSGGNQQKVMLGKWLATHPKVVFMDEPTRGIDVGAKAELHSLLRDLSKQGIGVVLISSELPEIIGMCDRVLVMREGRINGELTGDSITEENIMRYAAFRHDSLAV
nr:ATP-binding cassette domain-containing protein [Hydrogenispora ethanolica]